MKLFELRKIISHRSKLIILLVAIVVIVLSVFFIGEKRSDNVTEAFYMNSRGILTDESRKSLEDEYQKAFSKVYKQADDNIIFQEESQKLQGRYAETVFGDYCILNDVKETFHIIDNRKEYQSSMRNKKNVLGNNIFGKYFKDDMKLTVCNRNGLKQLVDLRIAILIGIFLSILLYSGIVNVEVKSNMSLLLATTKRGYKDILLKKYNCIFVGSFVIQTICVVSHFIACVIKYRITKWELISPLFYVSGFESCKGNLMIWQYIVIQWIYSLFAAWFFVMFALVVTSVWKRAVLSSVISTIILVLAFGINLIYTDYYHGSFSIEREYIISPYAFARFYKIWRLINPFSFIDVAYFYEQPRFCITTHFAIDYSIFSIAIIMGCLIGFASIVTVKSKYPRRELSIYE